MKKTKYNSQNELIKTKFFGMLENAKGRDPKTVDSYVKAIHEFEVYSNFLDFKKFNTKLAVGFKEYLSDKKNKRTGQNISKSYLRHCTSQLREFFEWLSRQKGYDRYIQYDDVQYFTLSRNNRNKARATNYQESYTIEEIISTIRKMPSGTPIEMRNKAIISLALLTTPRISALQTARIGSIKYYRDFDAWAFVQNPNLVDTKFAKHITAFFIGNVEDLYKNVLDFVEFLKLQGFTDTCPLFPKIISSFTKEGLPCLVLEKDFVKSQSTIRAIFKQAFHNNDLPYHKPHSFRHAITRRMMQSDRSPLLISNLAQNLGHEKDQGVIISCYGTSPEHDRAGILKSFELE
ncbi:TPA: tyrosine-type recombinase/integrase [Legionella pneumophila subsp. pneumophila]|nr:tyrosine-type recombinase/integrase [Legionella pneumophila subsp. pneumophila]